MYALTKVLEKEDKKILDFETKLKSMKELLFEIKSSFKTECNLCKSWVNSNISDLVKNTEAEFKTFENLTEDLERCLNEENSGVRDITCAFKTLRSSFSDAKYANKEIFDQMIILFGSDDLLPDDLKKLHRRFTEAEEGLKNLNQLSINKINEINKKLMSEFIQKIRRMREEFINIIGQIHDLLKDKKGDDEIFTYFHKIIEDIKKAKIILDEMKSSLSNMEERELILKSGYIDLENSFEELKNVGKLFETVEEKTKSGESEDLENDSVNLKTVEESLKESETELNNFYLKIVDDWFKYPECLVTKKLVEDIKFLETKINGDKKSLQKEIPSLKEKLENLVKVFNNCKEKTLEFLKFLEVDRDKIKSFEDHFADLSDRINLIKTRINEIPSKWRSWCFGMLVFMFVLLLIIVLGIYLYYNRKLKKQNEDEMIF